MIYDGRHDLNGNRRIAGMAGMAGFLRSIAGAACAAGMGDI